MKRRLRKPIRYTLYAIGAVAFAAHYVWYINDLASRPVQHIDPIIIEAKALEMPVKEECTDIIVTNYYYGDGTSGKVTASGKKISDFQVNDRGMYTYNDYVVVATANTNRLKWSINEGFKSHDLYEVLDLEIDGERYEAIVLDVCGSCYGVDGEDNQRYDVFTTGNVIGKVKGKLYESIQY